MEEPAEENVTKTSDNLEMAELNPVVPVHEDEDINVDGEKWINWNFCPKINVYVYSGI